MKHILLSSWLSRSPSRDQPSFLDDTGRKEMCGGTAHQISSLRRSGTLQSVCLMSIQKLRKETITFVITNNLNIDGARISTRAHTDRVSHYPSHSQTSHLKNCLSLTRPTPFHIVAPISRFIRCNIKTIPDLWEF